MTKKERIIEKWLQIISDDYMHFDESGMQNAREFAKISKIKEYGDKGVMMYAIIRDIDNKLKTQVLLFYVKPEYRGSKLFLTMIKNLENIAIKERTTEIIVGASISGYKEEKFNKIFTYFGYQQAGFIKRV